MHMLTMGEGYVHVVAEVIWDISVPFIHPCSERKTYVKNKVF